MPVASVFSFELRCCYFDTDFLELAEFYVQISTGKPQGHG
jgi:hypothetical protein